MTKHQHITNKTKGKIRTTVNMRRGEVISLCRCWHSENFPLCDGTHKDRNDSKGPVTIHTDCDNEFLQRKQD